MKDKQEQIEEMAKDIYNCKNCPAYCDASCGCYWEASRYYKKGYRKASDVIDEFVERMKEENETSFRRYGKGIGMHDIFLISDKMKFEIFAETRQEDKQ